MSATSTAYYPAVVYYPAVAVVQQVYLTRLTLVESYPSFHWDTLVSCVPQVVNDALGTLDNALLNALPGIIIHSRKAMVRDQALCVYHTYSNTTSEADSVVVGLSLERSDISVTLRGDIVTEEAGSVFFELMNRSFAGDDARILESVKSAAKQLASQPNVIVQALVNL